MDIETSPLPLAQSALLLMAWVPPSNLTLSPYKTWLGRAIQHAQTLNADRPQNIAEPAETPAASRDAKQKNTLRRLWWCCIALDRVSPLCTRFAHHITRENYDFGTSKPLNASDLENEIYRSSVYNPISKRRLIDLFEIYLDLMLILTDVLALIMPIAALSGATSSSVTSRIGACEAALQQWFARASAQLPLPSRATAASEKKQGLNRSVALHTSLMYIYF